MPLRPNPNLYIPITFKDADGLEHTSDSWAKLILKVIRYRQKNDFPVGDVEKEVIEQACSKWPDRCVHSEHGRLPALEDDLNMRVLGWLVSTIERKPTFVSENEARRRMEICAVCPRQSDWRNKCGSCAARADEIMKKILEGKPLEYGKNLKGCSSLSEDTRVSVWIEQAGAESGRLPVECWRK